MTDRPARIAIVTVSDRASRGEYEDKGGPGAEAFDPPVFATNAHLAHHPKRKTARVAYPGRFTTSDPLRTVTPPSPPRPATSRPGRR